MADTLSMEEIEEAARDFKDDLQREANRAVRQKDAERALIALESIEYLDIFVGREFFALIRHW